MGVLEHTSEQRVYVPPSRKPDVPYAAGMLGERTDLPRADYGMDYLQDMVGVADNWFVYGKPPEATFVYQPELFTHAKLSPDLMHTFWRNTYPYAAGEGLATMDDVMEVARGGLGVRRTIFEVSFETWDTERWVADFVGELHQLFMAGRPDDVLRDDRLDSGGYPENPHYTEVRVGSLGASTVFLITRSRLARDKHGREVIARLVELVKPDPDTADDILCELSLTEQLRLEELLLREQATGSERAHVVKRANRRNMQRDRHSVRTLIQEFHHTPELPLWRKAAQGILGLLDRAADTNLVRRIADALPWGREEG
jgi:hypothetical protein